MPDAPVPPDIQRLLVERSAARDRRDWARADAIRDELVGLGWEVQDAASGSSARPILRRDASAADSAHLDDPATVALSVQVVAEDHPEDLDRFLRGLMAHPPAVDWELVIVANGVSPDQALAIAEPVSPVVVPSDARLGWADARTLGFRHSRGAVTVLVDSSLEPTGDAWTPLLDAFDDARVGIAGPWGVTSGDARQFEEAPPGEVDAVEAYCIAVRRPALQAVRGFDHRFRFYRNADLDFSFAVRDAGWIAVRTASPGFERHVHRGWTSLPDDERDRVSRRNFYRFLDRWGSRRDLLLHPDGA